MTLYNLSCPHCDHIWWSKKAFPKRCPKCKSRRDLSNLVKLETDFFCVKVMIGGDCMANILLECCGTRPKIKVVTYPGTTYEMFVIECQKCGARTQPYRNLNCAYNEWNNPENVHLN